MTRLVCLGLGYCAQALARSVTQRGWTVAGTARAAGGTEALRGLGYEAWTWAGEGGHPDVADRLRQATHVLISAPPGPSGDPVLRHFAADLAAASNLSWIGYLSTVGVYGDTRGGWVDEGSPVEADFDRTRWRIAAETDWLALGLGNDKRVQIFRLAGIYGPGRSAFDSLRAGRARRVIKPGQVFNRVHVEDISGALQAGMGGRGRHEVYNVADDEPAPPQDVITYAADLLGLPAPPEIAFEDAALSDMARSFYLSNRRVSNARMKGDLGVRLAYPTFREGLQAIARASRRDS